MSHSSKYNLLLNRTFQYLGIILIVAAMGGGYWYWKNAKAAQQVTDNRPSFEAPLTTDLNLTAGQGIATYSRADGADRRATVTDFEGRIIPVKAGEARFDGARRVENLISYSEDFSNAAWVKSGTATVTGTNIINLPNIGDYIRSSSAVSNGIIGEKWTWSVVLSGSGTVYVYAQLFGGTVEYFSQSFSITLTSTPTRYSYTGTTAQSGHTGAILVISRGSTGTATTVTANYAQLENVTGQANQNPSEYVSTNVKTAFPYHGAGVDGVKYFDTQNGNTVASNVVTEATGAAIPTSTLHGYLAEGSRANAFLQSEDLSTTWTPTAVGEVLITTDATIAPNGRMNADKLIEGTTASLHRLQQSASATLNTAITASVYVKAAERSRIRLNLFNQANSVNNFQATFNIGTQTIDSSTSGGTGSYSYGSIVSLPNGWYRVSMTGIIDSGVGAGTAWFQYRAVDASGGQSYTGDGISGIYVWGSQLEQASFASSYIPTTTASVTRATDALSYPAANANPAIGSAFAEVQSELGRLSAPNVNSAAVAVGGDGGRLLGATFAGTPSKVYAFDGTTAVSRTSGGTFATMQKIASKWGGASYAVYKNATSTSGSFDGSMASGVVYVGSYGSAASSNYGTVKNVRIWKKALTDTELQNMTSATEGIATSAVKKTILKNTPNTTGLVGYWSFEDGSGTKAEDFSPSSTNTGTLTNGPAWVDGKIGKALSFDGTDDYVSSGDVLNMGISNFSISAWVKSTSTTSGSNNGIVYKRGTAYQYSQGYRLNMPNGVFNFHIADGTNYISLSSTTAGKNDGGWHHVVGVAERGVILKLYIDGVLDGTAVETTVGNIDSSGTNFAIGALNTAGTSFYHPFNGLIDDVRIYNRALSASEIAGLYAQGSTGKTTMNASQNNQLTSGLVGLWSFNGSDVSGTTAYDRSGSGNNGTLTNGPSIYPGKVGQSIDFDGTDDYVSAADAASLDFGASSDFVLSGWVYRDTSTTDDTIVAKRNGIANTDDGYIAYIDDTDGKLHVEVSDNADADEFELVSNSTFTTPGWNHFAIVWDDDSTANTEIYINGVGDGATETGTQGNIGDLGNTLTLRVGAESDNGNPFDGKLDEIRVYNRTLSSSEIKDQYDFGGRIGWICGNGTVTDADTNVYGTIQIGTQCWMRQNMRVGTRIAVAGNQTNNATTEKYCYSDSDANCTSNDPNQPDGGLYQWDEAMQYVTTAGARGICPQGWHIPTDAEQYTLENYLKDAGQTCNASRSAAWDCSSAGTKLKPNGTSGFEGNLAGCALAGSFYLRGTYGFFWSSSESGATAWYRDLTSVSSSVLRDADVKTYAVSVRCIKD